MLRLTADFERDIAEYRLALHLSDEEARQLRAEILDEAYHSPKSILWVATWSEWRDRWYRKSPEEER